MDELLPKLQIEHPKTLRWPMLTLTDVGQTACVTVMNTDGAHVMFLREREVEQMVEWCERWLRKGVADELDDDWGY